MDSFSVKAKFQIGQIFCKCEDQFDIEGKGQGHKFLK